MIDTYFLSQRVGLLKDITPGLFSHYYPFLEEDKPPVNPQIDLVAFGIWLRIDRELSQFLARSYLLEIEQRLLKLRKLGWKAFNKTTDQPDGVAIGSVRGHPIGKYILAHLKHASDDDTDIPTEELRRAMQSPDLQKEMCAWLNGQELQRIYARISDLEGERDDWLGSGRYNFNLACKSLFKNWFREKGVSTHISDKGEASTETGEPKKRKPRRIDQYSHLKNHIKTFFPILLSELLDKRVLPVDEIFPEGVDPTSDEGVYLTNVFKQRLYKHPKYKKYKEEKKRLNEAPTIDGGKCFTIVEDRPPSEDGLDEISFKN